MDERERRIVLFGTEAEIAPRHELAAGPLTAELEDGNLRHVRIGAHEAIRAVSYIVRDRDWGTYTPRIENLRIERGTDRFTVTYDAVCRDAAQEYRYRARIEGTPERLVFSACGEAATDFITDRLGFVVLHPIAGVSGRPVEVLHVDGTIENSRFPELIDPLQPFMEIRALTHEPAPGVRVTCRMEGDTFEMEDQRNWTDASYKTYVRPLALPWPYRIGKGEVSEQSVTLTLSGRVAASASGREPVRIALGTAAGHMPLVGLALDPDVEVAASARQMLQALGPSHLRVRFDPRRHDAAALARAARLAQEAHAKLILEAVLPAAGDSEAEAQAIARAADEADATIEAVIVSPAPDLKGTLPGNEWPACPPLATVYTAMRKAFPGKPLGGGSYCFFTELNRKRPPMAHLDFVTHTTCAIVHAADDVSVMETLECLPVVIASARAIAAGKGYHVGPAAIGLPNNPYGAAAADNPANGRVAMARMDPRQRGLLGAAWHLGYLARCAEAGVDAVTLSAPVGEFGVIHQPMPYVQPVFDEIGGLYPAYHVLRGVARESGQALREVRSSRPGDVLALAVERGGKTVVWLANLGEVAKSVVIDGLQQAAGYAVLEAENVRAAAHDPAFLDHQTDGLVPDETLTLGAYAVCRIVA